MDKEDITAGLVAFDNIKLHRADCMEIMTGYPDNYFDLAVVDPPYGIDIVGQFKKSNTFKGNGIVGDGLWDKAIPSGEYFNEVIRVSGNAIIWGGNYFLDHLGNTRCMLIWDKMNGTNPMADAEVAWTNLDSSVRSFSMHHFSDGYDKKIHPTQKPTRLYAWIYKLFAKPGMKILDTHLGSGSNAIAAHYAKMGEFVGCELDQDYFDAACERVYKETRQQELF